MTSRTRAMVVVLVVVLCLVLTEQIARGLGVERAVGQASRWNKCYDGGLAWLDRNSPRIKGGDRLSIAANFCNGGSPNKPAR